MGGSSETQTHAHLCAIITFYFYAHTNFHWNGFFYSSKHIVLSIISHSFSHSMELYNFEFLFVPFLVWTCRTKNTIKMNKLPICGRLKWKTSNLMNSSIFAPFYLLKKKTYKVIPDEILRSYLHFIFFHFLSSASVLSFNWVNLLSQPEVHAKKLK